MSASQTWSGLSAVKLRSSRFGATGRSWRLSVVRGVRWRPWRPDRAISRISRSTRRRECRRPSRRSTYMSTGMDPWRAVDPPAGGEDAADLPAQLGFRLGTALDGGDRVEPSVEATDARTD